MTSQVSHGARTCIKVCLTTKSRPFPAVISAHDALPSSQPPGNRSQTRSKQHCTERDACNLGTYSVLGPELQASRSWPHLWGPLLTSATRRERGQRWAVLLSKWRREKLTLKFLPKPWPACVKALRGASASPKPPHLPLITALWWRGCQLHLVDEETELRSGLLFAWGHIAHPPPKPGLCLLLRLEFLSSSLRVSPGGQTHWGIPNIWSEMKCLIWEVCLSILGAP